MSFMVFDYFVNWRGNLLVKLVRFNYWDLFCYVLDVGYLYDIVKVGN